MSKLLPDGTELFFVMESIADRWFHDLPYHFEITFGKIAGVIEGGFRQYRVPTINRFGHGSNLKFPKTSDIGKSCWLTYDDAVQTAEQLTDKYEKTWAKYTKEPLLRPWRDR